jgi:rubrerythrin
MSSKRVRWRRGCYRKIGYHDLSSAYAGKKGHAKTFGESLDIYRCEFCGYFHLGHNAWNQNKSKV